MRKTTFVLFSTLLACGVLACSDDSEKPTPDAAGTPCSSTALLPADNAVGDFTRDGAPQEADTEKKLFDLINGGAEKYTQNKWVCLAMVSYKSATAAHTIEARLFDQTDAAGATAAYTATGTVDDVDITPVIGDAARGHENTVSDLYQADMRKGKYLARVLADKAAGKDDALSLLKATAAAVP
jgi:hypothetical protein